MKIHIFVLVISILLIVSTACGVQSSVDEAPNPPISRSASPAPAEQTTVTPAVSDKTTHFYDESVRAAIEAHFDKPADSLTAADVESLSELNYLVIENPVESLQDIPMLIPNIKYLKVSSSGTFSQEDLDILAGLKSLKALSLYTGPMSTLAFARHLPYLEVQYREDNSAGKRNNLGALSLMGQRFVDENVSRPIKKYVRVLDDSRSYEMVCSDYYEGEEYYHCQERKIFVSDKTDDKVVLHSVLDCSGEMGTAASNKLYLADVNFDGRKDILTDNGHFGSQKLVTFTCYLDVNDQYARCDSFSAISNPSVDSVNKKILSTWRNWAASHSWAMFSYDGEQYIMTDQLTEELVNPQDVPSPEEEIWKYTITRLSDGDMGEVESFTTDDYTDNQIAQRVFDKEGFWGLSSDKWNSSFNTGNMSDFSLYGDDFLSDTILQ